MCPVCVHRRASCRRTQVSCGDTHKLSALFRGSWPHCSALQTESLQHATHTRQGPHSEQNSLPVSHATITAVLCFHIRDGRGSAAAAEDRPACCCLCNAEEGERLVALSAAISPAAEALGSAPVVNTAQQHSSPDGSQIFIVLLTGRGQIFSIFGKVKKKHLLLLKMTFLHLKISLQKFVY